MKKILAFAGACGPDDAHKIALFYSKAHVINLLKPFSFLPAILMMYLIYSFSAQTGEVSGALSYEVSYQIVETKNEVLNENKTYDELAYSASSIEFYVRKAAHMTEYCLAPYA